MKRNPRAAEIAQGIRALDDMEETVGGKRMMTARGQAVLDVCLLLGPRKGRWLVKVLQRRAAARKRVLGMIRYARALHAVRRRIDKSLREARQFQKAVNDFGQALKKRQCTILEKR